MLLAKGPGKKMIAAMQEALKKAKEEEEKLKREEEERMRLEEERERLRLEKLQKEQEKKEKKKLKEKQRKEKLKAEGKLLTNKQKQAQARAQAMLEALRAQGVEMPEVGESKPRPGNIRFFMVFLCFKVANVMFVHLFRYKNKA